ncbi:MAG TPA: outer membrane beta-barrel protein [Terriglobales bacterium]|nr:outer membrane beta-barrel protein [Terriglobales bacterium]
MLRKRITVMGLALLALAAIETPLLADGEPSAAPPPGPVAKSSWSGFYLGIGGGMGNVDQSVSGEASKFFTVDKYKKHCHWVWYYPYYKCSDYFPSGHHEGGFTEQGSANDDEWHGFGTVQFGADYMLHDRFLIGAFADVDIYHDAGKSFSIKDDKLSASGDLDLERVWYVGGRLGLLVHHDFLLYGVGGYSQADIDSSSTVDFKYGPNFTLRPDDKLKGYFVGGGGEWKFHKNVALKVEYRYAKYDSDGDSDSASKQFVDYDFYHKNGYDVYEKEIIKKYYNSNADFDADIHSVRGVLVFRAYDEPAPTPLK